MRPCSWRVPWILAGFVVLSSLAAAQGGSVRLAMVIGGVQQLGPAYPGHPVAFEVRIRNVGNTECGACRVGVLGGGLRASRALPRIPPGGVLEVTLDGLVFSQPGKYVLAFVVDAPRDLMEFEAPKPHATHEFTVLEGAPPKQGVPR